MPYTKKEDWICPFCGDNESIEEIDYDFGDGNFEKIMFCPHCNKKWTDYFVLKYTGYSTFLNEEDPFPTEYDENGVKIRD